MNLKPTILIVDDTPENLHLLSLALREEYALRIAKDGPRALELASMEPTPDLILLDVMMPGMSGFEVCQILKANPVLAPIPIIFITALSDVEDETRGFGEGGADFITKPFHPAIVQARVKTHIALRRSQERSNRLLSMLLPDNVIDDLLTKGEHLPESLDGVSILFSDLVNFSSISSTLSPLRLIQEMSELFGTFDQICAEHGVYRIKTIGDAYMAANGLDGNGGAQDNAARIVAAADAFLHFLKERNLTAEQPWLCRVGIHTGSVIAGIIGERRFLYDILGHDVNVAARVESAGKPMTITVSESTYRHLGEPADAEPMGVVSLKGVGPMKLFGLAGERS